jgi:serine/threonine-protein kinase
MAADVDRNLLFGLLALQNGLIDQVQLVAAFQAWTRDKGRALAEHLMGRGDLDGDDNAAVLALVARHLKKHGGSTEKSLAAVAPGRSTCESLARVGDPVIEATLARVGTQAGCGDRGDPDQTAAYSVGSTTSDGQRFRVLRPHAKGGLGAVFVALDAELHREVALKQIVDSHADDPLSRARFLLEAEVTGALEHPGIVPVYGLGTYPDGRPYYAMRFIRGDSLKEAIDQFHGDQTLMRDAGRRTLELRKLLHRFTDVCNAIEYAHTRGVLHRDIKPGNIIVGKHGETLVVDWGLAKATGKSDPAGGERTLIPSSASGSSETLPGAALGTPAYMSPEQAEGELEHLGPRSDVYSLGATLYCLLTGKPPLEGDVADVIRGVQKGQFPPPRQVDPAIDRALEAVCLKAMALKPADRYGTPKALAEDVERWMADEPVSAWREPWIRTLVRWLTRHRVGVTAAGAAVLVALAGTAAVLAVQTRANAELKAANTELGVANTKVNRANAELAASNGRERARFALAQEAIRTFHTGVSEDVLLKEEEFKALRTRLLREAREFYRKLEGLLQGHDDRDSRLALGHAYFQVGKLTQDLDSIEEAGQMHRRALALFEDLARENPADPELQRALALGLQSLSIVLTSVGRADEALPVLERSSELSEALSAAAPADRRLRGEWARGEMLCSIALYRNHRVGEALEAIQRARAILEAAVVADPRAQDLQPELMEVYGALALILQESGRMDDALTAYRKVRDLGEARFRVKPEDPRTSHELVRTLGNMGILLFKADRPGEALEAFGRAREVLKQAQAANPTLSAFPATSAWIDSSAAYALVALGRNGEALEDLVRARTAREVLVRANPTVTRNREQLISIHRQIAGIHSADGRLPEGLASLAQAREIAVSLVDAHPEIHEYQLNLAEIDSDQGATRSEMGQPTESIARFDQALAVHRKLIEADPATSSFRSKLAVTLRRRGIAAQKVNRPAEAASNYRESIAVLRGLKGPNPTDLYDMACAQSLLAGVTQAAGSGLTAGEGRAAMAAAMAMLHEAVAAGWRNPASMRGDPDLAPLRSRADFQSLVADVEFPAEPFARRE